MKNRGLKNRFPQSVREVWGNWYTCLLCKMNGCDALHHIISSSNNYYVDGKHNESIFNSMPIHNQLHPNAWEFAKKGMVGFGITRPCHIGNDVYLHSEAITKKNLEAVAFSLFRLKYQPKEIDFLFLETYAKAYSSDTLEVWLKNAPKKVLSSK